MIENINWYPGHMKKTRELIQENRAKVLYDVKEIDPAKFITQGEKNKG